MIKLTLSNHRLNPEYEIRNMKYGIRNTKYEKQKTKQEVRNTKFEIRNTEYLPIQLVYWSQRNHDCQHRTHHWRWINLSIWISWITGSKDLGCYVPNSAILIYCDFFEKNNICIPYEVKYQKSNAFRRPRKKFGPQTQYSTLQLSIPYYSF